MPDSYVRERNRKSTLFLVVTENTWCDSNVVMLFAFTFSKRALWVYLHMRLVLTFDYDCMDDCDFAVLKNGNYLETGSVPLFAISILIYSTKKNRNRR